MEGQTEPGERRPRLDRPPAERFATEEGATASPTRPATATVALQPPGPVRAGLAGLAGAALLAVLGGLLAVTAGLVIVAAGIGWIVGSLARPARPIAIAIAVASVGLGLVGIWLIALAEGGVLGPLDYLAQVQGLLAPLQLAVAGLVAALTAR